MNIRAADLDWSLIQSFLAVADAGSLTHAASTLGVSQPTLGRHISHAEAALGISLFTRVRHGLQLTEAGHELLAAAREMHAAAARLSLTAAGQVQSLSGVVRITASIMMSCEILPAIIADLRLEEPAIEIELHASDVSDNLLFHEADIAVRMYRPLQDSVITRHIGDMETGLYASTSYLERRGVPESPADLLKHDWVGYDRSDLIIQEMSAVGWQVDRSFFGTRCDDYAAHWQLVKAGCGIGSTQVRIAERTPNVVRLVPGMEISPLPVWLTAPEALRQTPRIRRVYDYLAVALLRETRSSP